MPVMPKCFVLGTLAAFFGCVVSANSLADMVTATGTITAVGTQNRTISVTRETSSGPKTGSFEVAQDAKIRLNDKPANFESLAANQKVTLTYDTDLGAVTKIEAIGSSSDGGFLSIFDGKTLSGWKADDPALWSVENGAIVGRGRQGQTGFLYYEGTFTDFELEAEVKINRTGNSGLFFRTVREKEHPDGGYEVQILGTGVKSNARTGSLYKIAGVRKNPARDEEWFRIDLRAKGPQIMVRINGRRVVDTIDRNFATGCFALQCLCQNGPTIVQFRNIRVRRL